MWFGCICINDTTEWLTHCIIHLLKKDSSYFTSNNSNSCYSPAHTVFWVSWWCTLRQNTIFCPKSRLLSLSGSDTKVLESKVSESKGSEFFKSLRFFLTWNWILSQCVLQHHQIRFSSALEKWTPLKKIFSQFFLSIAGVGIAEKIANFPVCDTNGKGWMLVLSGKKPRFVRSHSNVCTLY